MAEQGSGEVQCLEITSTTTDSTAIHCLFRRNSPDYCFPRPRPSYQRFIPQHTIRIQVPRIPAFVIVRRDTRKLSTRSAAFYASVIFTTSLLALSLVYTSFPKLSEEESQHIRIPWNIEDAKTLGLVLNRYKQDNFLQVLLGVFVTYIFLQTFAIPGSLFLSILSGFLFPFYLSLILVCTCSAIGASLCFLLSQLVGRPFILKYFPERAANWAAVIQSQQQNLLNYVIFLRITPFLPNWFINLTAPIVGVPLLPFAVGTFLGVAPPSFVAIQAGKTLHTMTSTDSTFSWISVGWLLVFAVVSLVPIMFKQKLKKKFE